MAAGVHSNHSSRLPHRTSAQHMIATLRRKRSDYLLKGRYMELSIRTRDVKLTDALRERVTRRLEFALDTFGDHVEDAFVYLMDLNGPKGGVDKLCQITVRARGIGDLAVRDTA